MQQPPEKAFLFTEVTTVPKSNTINKQEKKVRSGENVFPWISVALHLVSGTQFCPEYHGMAVNVKMINFSPKFENCLSTEIM